MKAAGIICEFNPFHNGHHYLLNSVRQDLNPDALVCVMSGNFVQRGDAAAWNKYVRAKAAVLSGADLVIELPVFAAVNSAGEFARGGISILKGLGIVDTIAFGSECGNVELLKQIAELSVNENAAFSAQFREEIDKGISYPKAYKNAVSEQIKGLQEDFFDGSNNILALEYLKQNYLLNANMDVYTVKRFECEHDSLRPGKNIASGSYIRQNIIDGDNNSYVNFIPEQVSSLLSESRLFDFKAKETLFHLIRFCILNISSEELSEINEVSEGIENLLKKSVLNANCTDDLIHLVKSKRYTYARISRILIQTLLNIRKDFVREAFEHPYARVLAFNDKGRAAIKAANEIGGIPVITNVNKQVSENDAIMPGLSMDYHASDIYNLLVSNNIYENSDKVCNCIPCNI